MSAPSSPPEASSRLGLYLVVVVCALLAGFAYQLRNDGIFACPADGYEALGYVADCKASDYGDYDHGAVWFGLEPETLRSAANAEVLFLGSSRLQFALSSRTTADWFASRAIRHFLFGFSDTETVVFYGPVLERLEPRAKAIVINVDRFFDDRVTRPTRELLGDSGEARAKARRKQVWQSVHRALCAHISLLCGARTVVHRSRTTGAWQMRGETIDEAIPVSDGLTADRARWPDFARLAQAFVASLPVERECVVLTIVPTVNTKRAEAEAIAAALGLELVVPAAGELRTFDGSHLDAASAERWSAAFLEAAGARLRRCVGR